MLQELETGIQKFFSILRKKSSGSLTGAVVVKKVVAFFKLLFLFQSPSGRGVISVD